MGRPSRKEERRAQILEAFSRVLADHGYAGATIAAVAVEADIAPGLVHYNFKNKQELLSCLLKTLVDRFRSRTRQYSEHADNLLNYGDAALKLDEKSDLISAKCWVGIFAEAVRDPTFFNQMHRIIESEVSAIQRASSGSLSSKEASALLAYIVGALVLGAFAPKKTAGFAAEGFRRLVAGVRK